MKHHCNTCRSLIDIREMLAVSVPVGAVLAGYGDDDDESSEEEDDGGEPVKMMLCVNQETYRDGKAAKMRPGKVAAQW